MFGVPIFQLVCKFFFKIVELGSQLINLTGDYDVFMHEIHHKRKKDSPSGTAINLAEIIKSTIKSKTELLTETVNGEILPEQLHIASSRSVGPLWYLLPKNASESG